MEKFLLKVICIMFLGCLYANHNEPEEKIYIQSDQVILDNSGIFVDLEGKEKKISALYRDATGLFILNDCVYGECPCGHPAVNNCGECGVPNCPYYCRED